MSSCLSLEGGQVWMLGGSGLRSNEVEQQIDIEERWGGRADEHVVCLVRHRYRNKSENRVESNQPLASDMVIKEEEERG
ncbi:hypothetical protein HYQ46_013081 [Verticillium longisporum]|nr:hypothetical protein HYQ46_013081 [Verticillium longisporum]